MIYVTPMNTSKYRWWEKEYIDKNESLSQQKKYKGILPYIRIPLMTVLMMTGTWTIKSEDVSTFSISQDIREEKPKAKENEENLWAYEMIFKDGIRKALGGLNNICQIPKWWKVIEYFRDDNHPTLAGKKMSPQAVKWNNLPETFDISPREFNWSLSSMNFHLGKRTFNIEPWVGKIQHVYLNSKELIIETTFKDIVYDKEKELPRLMFKLWRTPTEKWKKEWFKWSTVTEL